MYKGKYIIKGMMLHSFKNNAGMSQLTEVLKIGTCTFVVPAFQLWFHSDMFWSF